MNGLRDLWSRLWAAVWVRYQLVRSRLPGHRGPAGPDYHLADHEIPRAGIDYEPLDVPANVADRLDAVARNLAAERGGPGAERRRTPVAPARRSLVLAAVTLLSIGAVGVGASALVSGSTGVAEVDRLLGIDGEGSPSTGRSDEPRPGASDAAVRISTDGTSLASSSYVDRIGRVCSASVEVDQVGAGGGSCVGAAMVAKEIDRRGVFVARVSSRGRTILVGYVDPDVSSLAVTGAGGSLATRLSEPWKVALPDLAGVRLFIAVSAPGAAAGETDPDDLAKAVNPDSYDFSLRMEDGATRRVSP